MQSPQDDRDWIFEDLARGSSSSLPDEYDLTDYVTRRRDQGSTATCAAIAGATVKEIQENMVHGTKRPELSPEFIYHHRRTKPAEGMYGRDVFHILRTMGVSEATFFKDKPTSMSYESALKHRIKHYARVTTIQGIKRAIVELGPCYLSLPMYSSSAKFWIPNGKQRTWHAVVAVGYDKHGVILLNSWEEYGFCTLKYDEWPDEWEAWIPIGVTFDDESYAPAKANKCCVLF